MKVEFTFLTDEPFWWTEDSVNEEVEQILKGDAIGDTLESVKVDDLGEVEEEDD